MYSKDYTQHTRTNQHLLIPTPDSTEIRCLVDETRERRGTHNEAQTASMCLSLKLICFAPHHIHTIAVTSPHAVSSRNAGILKATVLTRRISRNISIQVTVCNHVVKLGISIGIPVQVVTGPITP